MIMVLIPWTFIQHPLLHIQSQEGFSRLFNLDSTEKRRVISSFKATFSTVYQLRSGPSSGYTSQSQCGRLQTCHFKWQQQVIWILFPSKILLYIYMWAYSFWGKDFFGPNKHLFYCISTKKSHLLTPFFFPKNITLGEEMTLGGFSVGLVASISNHI